MIQSLHEQWTTGALAEAPFRRFLLVRTVSLLGSAMTPVALAFAVLAARQGQSLLGYVMAAELLPHLLMLLVGGAVADRYPRDRLIQLASVGSGASQAGIALVVLTGLSPYWLFPMAIANGVLSAFTAPAMRAIVPDLVSKPQIQAANALLNTVRGATRVVGPAAAGLLVATVGGGWGIALDAASFFVAALIMATARIPARPRGSSEPLLRHLREGWGYFRDRPWIWSITGAWAVMNAVQMGAWQVLGPIIARRTFGAAAWGLTLSVRALGLLAASLLMMRRQLSRPLRDGMLAAAVLGIPMWVLCQGLPWPYLAGAAFVAGAGGTVAVIAWDTALQHGVPRDKLSRIMAFDDLGAYVAIPLGEMLAVPLADRFGLERVVTEAGALFILAALAPLAVRPVRQLTARDIERLGGDTTPR
jgi:MFS family permease